MACGSCNRVAPRTRRLMRQPLRPFPPSTGAHRGAEGGAGWGGGKSAPLGLQPVHPQRDARGPLEGHRHSHPHAPPAPAPPHVHPHRRGPPALQLLQHLRPAPGVDSAPGAGRERRFRGGHGGGQGGGRGAGGGVAGGVWRRRGGVAGRERDGRGGASAAAVETGSSRRAGCTGGALWVCAGAADTRSRSREGASPAGS